MTEKRDEQKRSELPKLRIPSRTDNFLLALAFVNFIVVCSGIASAVTMFALGYCLAALGVSVTMKMFWNDFANRKNASAKQDSSKLR